MLVKNKTKAALGVFSCFYVATSFAYSIPEWLSNPTIKDGLAAVDCVKFSGNWSSDSKISSANARIALAQQIDVKVESLDKTYESRQSTQDGTYISTQFSSVSQQYTKQALAGSRIVKTEIVTISGTEYYCALATLDPGQTEQVFELIIKASNKKVDDELQSELFEQFKDNKIQSSAKIDNLLNNPQ
ncbi:hypothetical protein RT723_14855 [Psychrosphaera aquimarina]|uniref:LPP20 lipoprotein n=1 Tax=Psychrosphaera aquimarina TaxID=2044854 RepID=A0ABU3R3I5_9GAMM|nr:hypothetical protein [Psychrosphaera aquimarina]MDU0114246.1 hypothetical protein [Psychrosphaera aquimarina]